jgi:hypothetical protein
MFLEVAACEPWPSCISTFLLRVRFRIFYICSFSGKRGRGWLRLGYRGGLLRVTRNCRLGVRGANRLGGEGWGERIVKDHAEQALALWASEPADRC